MSSQTSEQTESIILTALLHSDEFSRKSLPHIKPEYFEQEPNRNLFKVISDYQIKYGKLPSYDAIDIELSNLKGISENSYQSAKELVTKITSEKAAESVHKLSLDWLVERTEKYCLDRSVYLAIMKSIDIIDGTNKKVTKDSIPEILQKALAVNFDTEIGHDYLENFNERFELYHRKETKIPTPLSMLNKVTGGGFPKKTLNLFISGTGGGKTHAMTYFASQYLVEGYNVLYITLEMAEERIAERIDSALMDVTMENLKKYPKDTFENKLQKIKNKTNGKLIIKEYPTGSINANNIRFLLDELKTKKSFVPDILVLDYINLVSSYRIRDASNTYVTVKNVAEEIRGLAQEKELMVLTASQTNRSGQTASDFELTEVSESHGLSMTADSMFGLIVTEDLEKLGQMRIKILKNRYGGKVPSSFVIGMNREKMTLHDLDKPVDDHTSNTYQVEDTPALNTFGGSPKTSKLSGFKV